MSFIAECTFCNTKVKVPDGADGLSVPCPRCGCSFTLAEVARASLNTFGDTKTSKKVDGPLASMRGPSNPDPLSSRAKPLAGSAPIPEEYVKQALGAEQLANALAAAEAADVPRSGQATHSATAVGAASLFFGSIGLVLAQIAPLSFLAVPLGAAGLLLGLVGILLSVDNSKRGWLLPVGGAIVSLGEIVVACFFPWVFGGPVAIAGEDARNAGMLTVVTIENGRSQQREAEEGEWVDASKDSLQLGPVRVRVTAVKIARLKVKDAKSKVRSGPLSLIVSIRLINTNGAGDIGYRSWQGDGSSTARLSDAQGHTHAAATLGLGETVVGHVSTTLLRPGGKPVSDVLAFRRPSSHGNHLRLELPAAAFGGSKTLRFQIPRGMIVEN